MTFRTDVYSNTQIFRHINPTFRAKLTATLSINPLILSPSLATNPIQDPKKLSWRTIENVLCQHTFTQTQNIQVFSKYHSCNATKTMTNFVVKIFSPIADLFMQQRYLLSQYLEKFAPFLLFTQSTLQPFKLALRLKLN